MLESQATFGGTWSTHRYPGIRSDSDLYTFGYRFKPWMGKPIATADEILRYLGEVIEEDGLASRIRYRHAIERAATKADFYHERTAGELMMDQVSSGKGPAFPRVRHHARGAFL